jgi:hypothetical protein
MSIPKYSQKLRKFRNIFADFVRHLRKENLFEQIAKERKLADGVCTKSGFARFHNHNSINTQNMNIV